MKRVRALLVPVAVLVATTCAGVASAQPSPSDVARAVTLFDDAKRELAAGNVDRACALFVDSYRADPQVGTLLNTALCHERAGKTASAWAEFTSVVSLAGRAGQARRSEFAGTHARALEPKLSRVRFEIQERADELALAVDDAPVAVAAARTTAIPVDPGSHVVRATAPGKLPWETKLVVAVGPSSAQLIVPSLPQAPVVVAPAPAKIGPPSTLGETSTPADDGASRTPALRSAAYVTTGAGIVALVVSGVTGALALSSQSKADRDCTGAVCRTPEALDANDRAHTFATVSTVGFVAGGAFAVASLVLFLVAPKTSRTSASAARHPPNVLVF